MTVFTRPPPDFRPAIEAAGCYIESNDDLLFLKRAPHRVHGNTWCMPGGKLEPGEDPRAAVVRETFEEAGLFIDAPDLELLGRVYVRDEVDYVFHIFCKSFSQRPSVHLNLDEHTEALWLAPQQIPFLPLIPGGLELHQFYLQKGNSP